MALTPSNMLPLGTVAPYFELPDTLNNNKPVDLHALKGEKGTAIMFICNHCPYVKHVNEELVNISKEYQKRGVNFIGISSNNIETHPEDSPEKMTEYGQRLDYPFPYLFDETQDIARAYDAACTPDFYLFDESMQLVYRGQLDDSRPGNGKPVSGNDLRSAIEHLLEETAISPDQIPSIGCNIKWK